MVTDELWESANAAVAKTVRPVEALKLDRDRHFHLLKGLVYCGCCNRSMVPHASGTYLLFTTQPNELMATIHDRMPVILPTEQVRRWVEPGPISQDSFAAMTVSYPAGEMEMKPVSRLVNSPRNDGPECLEGIDEDFRLG